ncbi:MAG: biopolymer transporter ExbD [Gammaproteobacteria bacterium]|nr:biopolymer transporter ExbD [Gammaproteobacteria bacterium]
MNFRSKQVEDLDVNLTPLIDVVFLLLIFFMVSTTFDQKSELNIDLPEAQGEVKKSENQVLEISINAAGDFYINENKLANQSIQTLIQELAKKIDRNNQQTVIIAADKNTPHQSVMRVMDAARRLNLTHLTFSAMKSGE